MDRTFLAAVGSAALATRGATARISQTSNCASHGDIEPSRRRDGEATELNLMIALSLRRSVAPSLRRSVAPSLCLCVYVTLWQSPNPKVECFDIDFIFAPVARRGSVSRSDSMAAAEKRNRAN